MDIMNMLPLLMMMNGNKNGTQQKSGGFDIAQMLNLMTMMNGGGLNQNATKSQNVPPVQDFNNLQSMLTPEVLALLKQFQK